MPLLPKVARAALHFWEEPCISGKNGSGTVFFSGCNLNCVFCQNYNVSHNDYGKIISYNRLADIFKELEEKGAHNINLLTPTHFVTAIIEALNIYRPNIPIVYNSSGYDCKETIKALKDYVDIYLMDFKYITNTRSEKYSSAENYPKYAVESILQAYENQPQCLFNDEIMEKGVIIRHLILPQGTNEAIKIFDWVRENTPQAYFSIMSQYTPYGAVEDYPEINRKITKREYEKVLNYILEKDFKNVYAQERTSSKEEYIPPFNLVGV